jgi:dipeptidyl aminopeptidase/acylaminoacyl peptidase
MLHDPGRSGAGPGVLFLHGLGGNRMGSDYYLVRIARELAERGIASLRFDFTGCGESEGEFLPTTAAEQERDARAALEVLKRQDFVDPERLGVLGYSFGGCIAALLLADVPFHAAAFFAAVASPKRLLLDRGEEYVMSALCDDGYVPHGALKLGPALVEESRSLDPMPGLANSVADVLIVHGDKDERVDLEHARIFERALRGRPGTRTETMIVPGMGHGAGTPARQALTIERIVSWFEETLSPQGG